MKCLILSVAVVFMLSLAAGAESPSNRTDENDNCLVVRAKRLYTMAGEPIEDGVVVIRNGKIASLGKASDTNIPEGFRELTATVVTPGLIDAHCTVGTSGILNIAHDQDQLEHSEPMQPELRAVDAFNIHDDLISWIREHGITTIHTGHAPGELISGQTLVVKTIGNTVEEAILIPAKTVSVTLTSSARKSEQKSPGTRGKMVAMLREALIQAQEYQRKIRTADSDSQIEAHESSAEPNGAEGNAAATNATTGNDADEPPERDLRLETLGRVLGGELVLMITADRAQDIASALRLAKEFNIRIWLDSAAEAYLLIDDIKAANVPVLIHPTMARATGERENLSFETAAKLVNAGIPVALQSGYESYVPKTRVVLFEAGWAAANGLTFEQTLATITIDAAKILGIDDRVGSLQVGKDGDLALFDGDPFEYTSHCVGVVIDGAVVSEVKR